MAKRNRTPKAKNKIEGRPYEGSLIKAHSTPFIEVPAAVFRAESVAVNGSTLFTAEFEAIIELIAKDRVYRAILAGLGRRLLSGT